MRFPWHALAIDEFDGTASLETAFSVATAFGLKKDEAVAAAGAIGTVTATWREVGKSHGPKRSDAEFMQSAFEHADLTLALASQTKRAGSGKGDKNLTKFAAKKGGSRNSSRQAAKRTSARQPDTRS